MIFIDLNFIMIILFDINRFCDDPLLSHLSKRTLNIRYYDDATGVHIHACNSKALFRYKGNFRIISQLFQLDLEEIPQKLWLTED